MLQKMKAKLIIKSMANEKGITEEEIRKDMMEAIDTGYNNPDIEAEGLERLHFEVKRVERLNVSEAMRQAQRDAGSKIPVVAHRRSREPWLITLLLSDFLREVKQ